MTRRLLYSRGSPFARRVRIVLIEKGLAFESDLNDGMRPPGDIQPHNPALQVPVLYDAGHCLFGTSLILDYLYATYPAAVAGDPPLAPGITRPARHWEDRLILGAIETVADTIVGLRLLLADGPVEAAYVTRQWLRIRTCLDWLEARITPEGFWPGVFSVMDLNLLCPLLFAEKRGMLEFRSDWPGIAAMVDRWADRPSVLATPINELARR